MMKKIIYLPMIMIVVGCSNQIIPSQRGNDDFLQQYCTEPTGIHKAFLDEVSLRSTKKVQTRSPSSLRLYIVDSILLFPDTYSVKSIPCYDLDKDKFMENPYKERIPECLFVPKDRIAFLVEAKTGEHLYMFAYKRVNKDRMVDPDAWGRYGVEMADLRLHLAWLGKELKKADSEEYTFVKFGGRSIYILYFKGEPVFYDSRGKILERIADDLKTFIEHERAAAARGTFVMG